MDCEPASQRQVDDSAPSHSRCEEGPREVDYDWHATHVSNTQRQAPSATDEKDMEAGIHQVQLGRRRLCRHSFPEQPRDAALFLRSENRPREQASRRQRHRWGNGSRQRSPTPPSDDNASCDDATAAADGAPNHCYERRRLRPPTPQKRGKRPSLICRMARSVVAVGPGSDDSYLPAWGYYVFRPLSLVHQANLPPAEFACPQRVTCRATATSCMAQTW